MISRCELKSLVYQLGQSPQRLEPALDEHVIAGVTAVSIDTSCLCVGGDCKYTVGEVSNNHARMPAH